MGKAVKLTLDQMFALSLIGSRPRKKAELLSLNVDGRTLASLERRGLVTIRYDVGGWHYNQTAAGRALLQIDERKAGGEGR